jgi:hypothetical protein
MAAAMDPVEAAECVLEGIRNNDLFILSHQEFAQAAHERGEALLASFPTTVAPAIRQEAAKIFIPGIYAQETARRNSRRK